MIDLAQNFGTGPVLMEDIARNNDISRKYLHTLLTTLKSAGLVRSIRGSGGGFELARAPSQIKLNEVMLVLEGSLSLVYCVEDKSLCERAEHCVTRDVWRELSNALERTLAGITLEDLIVRKKKKEKVPPMFNI